MSGRSADGLADHMTDQADSAVRTVERQALDETPAEQPVRHKPTAGWEPRPADRPEPFFVCRAEAEAVK
jgi:hypothetical protein